MISTEDLIKNLVKDHNKIIRNYGPIIRLVILLYGTFILAGALLYFKSPFIFKIQNTPHLLEIISIFLFINSFTYFSLQSLVPGSNKTKSFLLLTATIIFLILTMGHRTITPQSYNLTRDYCEIEAIAISIFTTIICHFLIKKSEFINKRIWGHLCFFSLPLLATFFLHLTCKLTFTHILTCHLIPPLIAPSLYVIIKTRKNKIQN